MPQNNQKNMIRPNRQVLNLTSLKSIKSEGNIKRAARKCSVGGGQSSTFEKKVKLVQSHKYLPVEPSEKTVIVSPQRENLPASYLSPAKSLKGEIIKQFNQQFLLHRSNNLNLDIEEIEKYKKELERSFAQLKRLQSESRESIRIINNLNLRIQELEGENKELKRLGGYKDSLVDSLQEKIRVMMDEIALAQRGKSSHTMDIIVSTEKQIKNMKSQLIDLSRMESMGTRGSIGIPKPQPRKETLSRDLTNSSLSLKQIKEKDQVKVLEEKLRTSDSSLSFYKQREKQLQEYVRQLQAELEKFQLNNKTSFQTNKDTFMMLLTQAASLEAMIA